MGVQPKKSIYSSCTTVRFFDQLFRASTWSSSWTGNQTDSRQTCPNCQNHPKTIPLASFVSLLHGTWCAMHEMGNDAYNGHCNMKQYTSSAYNTWYAYNTCTMCTVHVQCISYKAQARCTLYKLYTVRCTLCVTRFNVPEEPLICCTWKIGLWAVCIMHYAAQSYYEQWT